MTIYKFENYQKITPKIISEVNRGIEIAGSMGKLARLIGFCTSNNINGILSGRTQSIHYYKYGKLKKLISNGGE